MMGEGLTVHMYHNMKLCPTKLNIDHYLILNFYAFGLMFALHISCLNPTAKSAGNFSNFIVPLGNEGSMSTKTKAKWH